MMNEEPPQRTSRMRSLAKSQNGTKQFYASIIFLLFVDFFFFSFSLATRIVASFLSFLSSFLSFFFPFFSPPKMDSYFNQWTILSLFYFSLLLLFFFLSKRGSICISLWSQGDQADFYAALTVFSTIVFSLSFFGSLSSSPVIPPLFFPILLFSSLAMKTISLFRLVFSPLDGFAFFFSPFFSLCFFLYLIFTVWVKIEEVEGEEKKGEEEEKEKENEFLMSWVIFFLSQIPFIEILPRFFYSFFVGVSHMGISGWFYVWFHVLLHSLSHYFVVVGSYYQVKKNVQMIVFLVITFCIIGLLLLLLLLFWRGEEGRGIEYIWGGCCCFIILYAIASYDLYYLERERKRELYALGREKELMKKRGMNVKRGKRG